VIFELFFGKYVFLCENSAQLSVFFLRKGPQRSKVTLLSLGFQLKIIYNWKNVGEEGDGF